MVVRFFIGLICDNRKRVALLKHDQDIDFDYRRSREKVHKKIDVSRDIRTLNVISVREKKNVLFRRNFVGVFSHKSNINKTHRKLLAVSS